MDRFSVEMQGRVYWIKDNQWKVLKQESERAVVLNFDSSVVASMICDALNEQWDSFLANPT